MTEISIVGTGTAIGAAAMSVLGVDHVSMIWGLVGALAALFFQSPKGSTLRSVAYIAISVPIGAVLGLAGADVFGIKSLHIAHFLCLLAGAGWQALLGAGIESAVNRIKTFGETGRNQKQEGQ